jgi:hypothetical protein
MRALRGGGETAFLVALGQSARWMPGVVHP